MLVSLGKTTNDYKRRPLFPQQHIPEPKIIFIPLRGGLGGSFSSLFFISRIAV
jgi:hypothetical protein